MKKRYVVKQNISIIEIPTHEKVTLRKGVIARLNRRVINGFLMRIYHCNELFYEFIISESDLKKYTKALELPHDLDELHEEFNQNLMVKRNSYLL